METNTETQTQLGVRWTRESIHLFKSNPALWMFASLTYMGVFIILPSSLGALGAVMIMLWPMASAYIVMLYRQRDLGHSVNTSVLSDTIAKNTKELIVLGLICLVYSVLINYLLDTDMAQLKDFAQSMSKPTEQQTSQLADMLLPLAIKLLLLIFPLLIATWFSPVLITLNGYSATKSIKSSIAGTLQYAIAMGVCSLLIFAILTGMILILTIVVGILGPLTPALATPMMLAVMLIATLASNALMFAFQYLSYRDIFRAAPVKKIALNV